MHVAVPENGYLDFSGSSWRCERGFRRDREACLPLQLPPNTHVDYSGNAWACNDGYNRLVDDCVTNHPSSR